MIISPGCVATGSIVGHFLPEPRTMFPKIASDFFRPGQFTVEVGVEVAVEVEVAFDFLPPSKPSAEEGRETSGSRLTEGSPEGRRDGVAFLWFLSLATQRKGRAPATAGIKCISNPRRQALTHLAMVDCRYRSESTLLAENLEHHVGA
ncbi:hypothetical protein HNQ50_002285 [Silvimonas terrae]|uniref:Uncharacterized protein n=1 Tax=Silvimonas terrae TaxID=300266 RepID=A0A840RDZ9_9NEIS|nr:hypothetical protein [Silvimonas terrae]MBB5191555.1 hypothetical protein [Silvimonas terrae]